MYVPRTKIAGLIPARKGSKRVTNKNLTIIDEKYKKSLLQVTLEEAAKAELLIDSYLTTDYLPKDLGFRLPNGIHWIDRPYNYAISTATANMYISHFFELYPEKYDAVVLLQPTCPLRTSVDIDNCIHKFLNSNAKTLVSAYRIPNRNKIYKPNGNKVYKESSDLDEENSSHLFVRNSAIYIFTREYFFKHRSIFGDNSLIYEMHPQRSIDIDHISDLRFAKILYKNMGEDDYDI